MVHLSARVCGLMDSDICRYLLVLEDDDIRLLLQAFQLSTNPCAAHLDAALLPVQMAARLLGTGRSHLLKVQSALGHVRHCDSQLVIVMVPHLPAFRHSPCLMSFCKTLPQPGTFLQQKTSVGCRRTQLAAWIISCHG